MSLETIWIEPLLILAWFYAKTPQVGDGSVGHSPIGNFLSTSSSQLRSSDCSLYAEDISKALRARCYKPHSYFIKIGVVTRGLPGGTSGKEPTYQSRRCRRCGFDPWFRKIPWRRAWQPIPVFLPGESHGHRSLVGYSPWACKESDTTEVTWHACMHAWLLLLLLSHFSRVQLCATP